MPGTGLATAARPTGNSAKRRIGENIEVKLSGKPRGIDQRLETGSNYNPAAPATTRL
jgi:hypothetical protein